MVVGGILFVLVPLILLVLVLVLPASIDDRIAADLVVVDIALFRDVAIN